MFKKVFQGALVGAAMLGLVGTAAATDFEINLYGASAQYLYWNDAADDFLKNTKGCPAASVTQGGDGTHGITYGTGCTGGHTYTIRYSSKASYDGILSLQGDSQYAGSGACNAGETVCAPTGGVVPAGQQGYYRKMRPSVGTASPLCCARVTLGASDVAGEAFIQESHGCLKGYKSPGAPNCSTDNVDRVFTGISTTSPNFLTSDNPLIVPFGFFAHNCITKTKCLSPNPIEGNPPVAFPGSCVGTPPAGFPSPPFVGTCNAGAVGQGCITDKDCEVGLTTQVGGTVNVGFAGLPGTGDPAPAEWPHGPTNPGWKNNSAIGGISGNWANHKAISRWGHQCYDPDGDGKSADCIGYWKCVESKCVGGTNKGNYCDQVTDCPDVLEANTACVRVPIDNISRIMAVLIFSGQVDDWQDFGLWWDGDCNPNENYDPNDPNNSRDPITACFRHAGSGTHATMDLAIMSGGALGWGGTLPQYQLDAEPTQTGLPGYWGLWFNDGSSDMMKCINERAGAIGYADCDQLIGSKSPATGSPLNYDDFPYEFVHEVKYNGVECRRAKIRNGEYDFFSTQWIYWDTNVLDASEEALVADLMTFAKQPGNLPSRKADYWASLAEMNVAKGSDYSYPAWSGTGQAAPFATWPKP